MSIATLIGGIFAESGPEYEQMINNLRTSPFGVPEAVIQGLELSQGPIASAGGDLLGALKTRLENGFKATIPVSATVNMNLTANSKKNQNEAWLQGFAGGTDYSPDTFIAGEHGPELIVGAEGSKVFTNSETRDILSTKNRPFEFSSSRQSDSDGPALSSEKHIKLSIQGNGAIAVGKGNDKDAVVDIMIENLKPVLLSLLKEEVFEEGDYTYEF